MCPPECLFLAPLPCDLAYGVPVSGMALRSARVTARQPRVSSLRMAEFPPEDGEELRSLVPPSIDDADAEVAACVCVCASVCEHICVYVWRVCAACVYRCACVASTLTVCVRIHN